MAEFKVRSYGKKHAKVMHAGKEILSQYAPDGSAREYCQKLANVLNDAVGRALVGGGRI